MGVSDEDKILIKNVHYSKGYWGYGAKKLQKEFPEKGWSKKWLSRNVVSTRDKSIVSVSQSVERLTGHGS